MSMKSYQSRAELFLNYYLPDDYLVPYTSIAGGIFACQLVYHLSQIMSSTYFRSYSNLTKIQRIEWNNRAISTIHALFITAVSLYLVFISDLFSDKRLAGLIILRNNALSTCSLGVSVGYFIADLGMIFWYFPSLGGLEYVVHHILAMVAVAYAMMTGEGQLYTYMVLLSETTTPAVNLRWYLDTAGLKKSKAYFLNGVVMSIAWLVARILLFIYLFYHVYLHLDQVKELHSFAWLLVIMVPAVLSILNLMWFWKIIKGLKKTLTKRQ